MEINQYMVFGQPPHKDALPNFIDLFYKQNSEITDIDSILTAAWEEICSFHDFAALNKREYWYNTKINIIFTKGGSRYSFWHGLSEKSFQEGLEIAHIFRVANAYKKDKLRRVEIVMPIMLGKDDHDLLKSKYTTRSRATIYNDMFGTSVFIEY